MTHKSIKEVRSNEPQHRNCKFHQSPAYGKPTKPRHLEPSMYDILSWSKENGQSHGQQYPYCLANQRNQHQQAPSMKKIVNCKSLPAKQFHKNIKQNNFQCLNHGQHQCCNSKTQQIHNQLFADHKATRIGNIKVKMSNVQEYLQNPRNPNITISVQKNPNSTKFIGSQKQTKIQAPQADVRPKNQKSLKQKDRKLQKKSLPFYQDPDKKPRYMQEKKTAVQKFIQSDNFEEEEFQKMKQEEIKRFKQTTRDLSNTAFLTYFNRPPFQNYGRSSKNPAGVLYGDDMYSHNVYPHTGQNKPKKQQTYVSALTRAKSAGNIRPHPSLSRNIQEGLISKYLTLTQIYPKKNQFESIPVKNQTVLQNLPRFNYSKASDKDRPKYSPYLKADVNEDLFLHQNAYLKKEQIPKFHSSKNQVEGKQITYTKKIQQSKKISS